MVDQIAQKCMHTFDPAKGDSHQFIDCPLQKIILPTCRALHVKFLAESSIMC